MFTWVKLVKFLTLLFVISLSLTPVSAQKKKKKTDLQGKKIMWEKVNLSLIHI